MLIVADKWHQWGQWLPIRRPDAVKSLSTVPFSSSHHVKKINRDDTSSIPGTSYNFFRNNFCLKWSVTRFSVLAFTSWLRFCKFHLKHHIKSWPFDLGLAITRHPGDKLAASVAFSDRARQWPGRIWKWSECTKMRKCLIWQCWLAIVICFVNLRSLLGFSL